MDDRIDAETAALDVIRETMREMKARIEADAARIEGLINAAEARNALLDDQDKRIAELSERVKALSWMGEGYALVERRAEAAEAQVKELEAVVKSLSRLDTPADLDAHLGAVLAEVAAQIRSQLCSDDGIEWIKGNNSAVRSALAILKNYRYDALTALDRARREARVDGMRKALEAIPSGWTGQPHCSNMDFGPNVSVLAKAAILALIAAEERGEGKP